MRNTEPFMSSGRWTATLATALATLTIVAVGCGSSSDTAAGSGTSRQASITTATTSSSAPYTLTSDLAYAPAVGRGHLLDVYVPTSGKGPFPVIMYQAGSAFMSDDTKAPPSGGGGPLGGGTTAASLAKMWASKGYVVVGYNVRSSSQAQFPAQLYDVKAAIRYLRANAAKYKIDPGHIGIMGTSSGSWAASMAGVTGDIKKLEGDLGNNGQSSKVQAVADLFGPTDFLTMDSQRIATGQQHDPAGSPESLLVGCALQTCKAKARAASPVTYVTRNEPPFYISHGTQDPLVAYKQSVELFKALAKKCNTAQLAVVPGMGHTDSYLTSASKSPGRTVYRTAGCKTTKGTTPAPTYASLLAFFNRTLK